MLNFEFSWMKFSWWRNLKKNIPGKKATIETTYLKFVCNTATNKFCLYVDKVIKCWSHSIIMLIYGILWKNFSIFTTFEKNICNKIRMSPKVSFEKPVLVRNKNVKFRLFLVYKKLTWKNFLCFCVSFNALGNLLVKEFVYFHEHMRRTGLLPNIHRYFFHSVFSHVICFISSVSEIFSIEKELHALFSFPKTA